MIDDLIPLLTKPFNTYTAAEYKLYVSGLYSKPPKKEPKVRLKKMKPPYVWSVSPKKKQLKIKVNRNPMWLSDDEMMVISTESRIPLSRIFIIMKKNGIIVSTLDKQS